MSHLKSASQKSKKKKKKEQENYRIPLIKTNGFHDEFCQIFKG